MTSPSAAAKGPAPSELSGPFCGSGRAASPWRSPQPRASYVSARMSAHCPRGVSVAACRRPSCTTATCSWAARFRSSTRPRPARTSSTIRSPRSLARSARVPRIRSAVSAARRTARADCSSSCNPATRSPTANGPFVPPGDTTIVRVRDDCQWDRGFAAPAIDPAQSERPHGGPARSRGRHRVRVQLDRRPDIFLRAQVAAFDAVSGARLSFQIYPDIAEIGFLGPGPQGPVARVRRRRQFHRRLRARRRSRQGPLR